MLSDLNMMRNPSIVSAQRILLVNIIVVVVASMTSLGNELTAQSDARNLDTYHHNKERLYTQEDFRFGVKAKADECVTY
jgi:hypothetical protein